MHCHPIGKPFMCIDNLMFIQYLNLQRDWTLLIPEDHMHNLMAHLPDFQCYTYQKDQGWYRMHHICHQWLSKLLQILGWIQPSWLHWEEQVLLECFHHCCRRDHEPKPKKLSIKWDTVIPWLRKLLIVTERGTNLSGKFRWQADVNTSIGIKEHFKWWTVHQCKQRCYSFYYNLAIVVWQINLFAFHKDSLVLQADPDFFSILFIFDEQMFSACY